MFTVREENYWSISRIISSLLLIAVIGLFACLPSANADEKQDSTQFAPFQEQLDLTNLSYSYYQAGDLIKLILAYQSTGRWDRERKRIIVKAQNNLRRQLAHRSSKPAIVLDIDETSLSNWDLFASTNFQPQENAFSAWVTTTDAPPIRPTLRLYRFAQRHKVKIFFITGRDESLRAATERNLKAAGFTGSHKLILRPLSDKRRSVVFYKSTQRCKIENQGYKVLLNLGDQVSDLKGGCSKSSYKLPNPMYMIP